jgi:hypothetical protein
MIGGCRCGLWIGQRQGLSGRLARPIVDMGHSAGLQAIDLPLCCEAKGVEKKVVLEPTPAKRHIETGLQLPNVDSDRSVLVRVGHRTHALRCAARAMKASIDPGLAMDDRLQAFSGG